MSTSATEDFAAALETFTTESEEAIGEDRVIKGTVLKLTPTHVVVDIGAKSEGMVTTYAAHLINASVPPLVTLEDLSPSARAFYGENRRVSNGRAKRLLGWRPTYPSFREGLRALSATMSPASVRPPPIAAPMDQR